MRTYIAGFSNVIHIWLSDLQPSDDHLWLWNKSIQQINRLTRSDNTCFFMSAGLERKWKTHTTTTTTKRPKVTAVWLRFRNFEVWDSQFTQWNNIWWTHWRLATKSVVCREWLLNRGNNLFLLLLFSAGTPSALKQMGTSARSMFACESTLGWESETSKVPSAFRTLVRTCWSSGMLRNNFPSQLRYLERIMSTNGFPSSATNSIEIQQYGPFSIWNSQCSAPLKYSNLKLVIISMKRLPHAEVVKASAHWPFPQRLEFSLALSCPIWGGKSWPFRFWRSVLSVEQFWRPSQNQVTIICFSSQDKFAKWQKRTKWKVMNLLLVLENQAQLQRQLLQRVRTKCLVFNKTKQNCWRIGSHQVSDLSQNSRSIRSWTKHQSFQEAESRIKDHRKVICTVLTRTHFRATAHKCLTAIFLKKMAKKNQRDAETKTASLHLQTWRAAWSRNTPGCSAPDTSLQNCRVRTIILETTSVCWTFAIFRRISGSLRIYSLLKAGISTACNVTCWVAQGRR